MSKESQTVLARYEASRWHYRVAVLASFNTSGRGAAILAAIKECRVARAALERVTSSSPELESA